MRSALTFAAMLSSATLLEAEPAALVYVPAKSNELWTVALQPDAAGQPALVRLHTLPLELPPGPIARHPVLPRLYVTTGFGPNASITTCDLSDPLAPTLLGRVSDLRGGCYLQVDPTGQFLFSVSHNDGPVSVYPLDENGMPGELAHRYDPGKSRSHSIVISPDNRFAYVAFVKQDNDLQQLAFDTTTGALTPLDPIRPELDDAVGPRHLAWHPTLPVLYSTNEQQLGVSAYTLDTASGQLSRLKVESARDTPATVGRMTASDIAVSPDGCRLFSLVRHMGGKDNQIIVYDLDATGEPTRVGAVQADAIPWSMQLSPDGRLLFVVASAGKTLTAYRLLDDAPYLEPVANLDLPDKTNTLLVAPAP